MARPDHELRVGIRSGGHSWVGNGVRDGGLLLSRAAGHHRRPGRRVASFSRRPRARDLLSPRARSVLPTGHAPTVGIGGFILGGGYGWNSRHLGPACLSILAVDAVLADGSLVHATDDTHPDLMWAVRGSGPGFFAVVTRFHLRVYAHPVRILRTVHSYPLELRDDVLAFAYDAVRQLPTEVEISAKVGYTPGRDEHTVSLTATAFCGPDTVRARPAP